MIQQVQLDLACEMVVKGTNTQVIVQSEENIILPSKLHAPNWEQTLFRKKIQWLQGLLSDQKEKIHVSSGVVYLFVI